MPKFAVAVPHTLTKDEATERVKHFTERVKEHYQDQVSGLEQSWEGEQMHFAFSTFGIKVGGRLHVEDDQVAVNGDLPFSAAMFKGKIESTIRDELAKLLA